MPLLPKRHTVKVLRVDFHRNKECRVLVYDQVYTVICNGHRLFAFEKPGNEKAILVEKNNKFSLPLLTLNCFNSLFHIEILSKKNIILISFRSKFSYRCVNNGGPEENVAGSVGPTGTGPGHVVRWWNLQRQCRCEYNFSVKMPFEWPVETRKWRFAPGLHVKQRI